MDFRKIFNLMNTSSKTKKAIDSAKALDLLFDSTKEYIDFNKGLSEYELANIVSSEINFIRKRDVHTFRHRFNIKDIFIADMGINYKPELSYVHPVIIIEKVGNMLLVVPCSTNPSKFNFAFHPTENPNGDKKLRRVKHDDGFDRDTSLLLSKLTVISQGRLIEKKSSISNNLLKEIKDTCFKMYFPKQYIEREKIFQQNEILKEEKEHIEEKYEELEKKYKELKSKMNN